MDDQNPTIPTPMPFNANGKMAFWLNNDLFMVDYVKLTEFIETQGEYIMSRPDHYDTTGASEPQ